MKSKYKRAISYAFKCHPVLYRDIVHQAYVKHFDARGTDLFDKDMFVILTWLKYIWYNEINKGKYMKDGEWHKKKFYTPSEEWTEDTGSVILASTSIPADKQLMSKEFREDLFKRVDEYSSGQHSSINTNVLSQFLNYIDNGYTYPEICEEMGMSAQRIHYYKKKLQKIIKDMDKEGMRSPFNGDTTKVTKTITRKTFEANESYKDYKYDPNAGCDFNEWFCTVTNGKDFILIKENYKDGQTQ